MEAHQCIFFSFFFSDVVFVFFSLPIHVVIFLLLLLVRDLLTVGDVTRGKERGKRKNLKNLHPASFVTVFDRVFFYGGKTKMLECAVPEFFCFLTSTKSVATESVLSPITQQPTRLSTKEHHKDIIVSHAATNGTRGLAGRDRGREEGETAKSIPNEGQQNKYDTSTT